MYALSISHYLQVHLVGLGGVQTPQVMGDNTKIKKLSKS